MRTLALLALAAACPLALANKTENDEAMLRLATDSGCMACHSLQPQPRRADGLPPIAPSWREVSLKYRNDPLAYEKLTRTVIAGSRPASRHWSGQVGPANMPPNAGSVSEADARMLVNWLLVLVP